MLDGQGSNTYKVEHETERACKRHAFLHHTARGQKKTKYRYSELGQIRRGRVELGQDGSKRLEAHDDDRNDSGNQNACTNSGSKSRLLHVHATDRADIHVGRQHLHGSRRKIGPLALLNRRDNSPGNRGVLQRHDDATSQRDTRRSARRKWQRAWRRKRGPCTTHCVPSVPAGCAQSISDLYHFAPRPQPVSTAGQSPHAHDLAAVF